LRNSPNSIGNAEVTSIIVNANETVAFYNGTNLLRSFGEVRNISASRDRQYITITTLQEDVFQFDIWNLESTGSIPYSPLDRFSPTAQADYNARFEEIFAWVCLRAFRGCCGCSSGSSTGGQFIYEYNSATSTGDFYFVSGILLMSFTADNGQDMTGILENLPNGSWITFIGSSNPDNFVTFEISSYYVASGIAIFSATVIAGDSSAFADTDLFATYFDKAGTGGGGGGVETVTGTAVDNTDPLNPVIDYTPWNDLTGVPEDNEDLVNRVQNSEWIVGPASGTNTYTVTLTPTLTAYVNRQVFWITFGNTNTGASTLNIDGLGAIPLVKNVSTALVSGDITAGAILPVIYDGTNFQIDLKYAGIPTFQQVLIAGATMTQNNTIAGAGFSWILSAFFRLTFSTTNRVRIEADGGAGNESSVVVNAGNIASNAADTTTSTQLDQVPTGFEYTGAIKQHEFTAASAATTDLAAVDGNTGIITGTTTITAFGTVRAGAAYFLTFSGILTLTHNATSLILPTGANIVTAAGDTCIAISLGGRQLEGV